MKGASLSKEQAFSILSIAAKIRETELLIAEHYPEQKMRCPTHLCLGQEMVAAVFGCLSEKKDAFFGNYRSHGHYLAKGGRLQSLFSEILGSSAGCSGGLGGSMHLVDAQAGFMGSSAIVAGTIPIGAGAAWAMKLKKTTQVTVIFFGDAAVEEGYLYETVNFSVLHQLPVLFICENNRLAIGTPIEERACNDRLSERFVSMGLLSRKVDPLHCELLFETAEWAYQMARSGKGPVFVECPVPRWASHVGPAFEGPVHAWWQSPETASGCALAALAARLIRSRQISLEELGALREKIRAEVNTEYERALLDPPASIADIETYFYASKLRSQLPAHGVKSSLRCLPEKPISKIHNPF